MVIAMSLALHGLIATRLAVAHAASRSPVGAATIQVAVLRPPLQAAPPPPPPPPEVRANVDPPPGPPPKVAARSPSAPGAAGRVAPPDGIAAPSTLAGDLFAGEGGSGSAPGTAVPQETVAAAPPPPPPPPPPPLRTEAREGASYARNPRPPYPKMALREGWEGTVMLEVRVLPSGRPAAIAVRQSSGRTVLDEAAVAAVRGWTFTPATADGVPVSGVVGVPIVFRLQ